MSPPVIQNLCPNPSFEIDLLGWTPLPGTTITQTSIDAVAGQYSMQVVTDGLIASEGFYGPECVPFASSGPASLSLNITGESGSVIISAVSNPGGVILASQVVSINPGWQRIEFPGLAVTAESTVYILLETTVAQDLTFLVDAVQYEPSATVSEYIDGDKLGCQWLGTPGLSASELLYFNAIAATGGMYLEGTAAIIDQGEIFTFGASGDIASGGTITGLVVGDPVGALDDFALWPSSDIDPAMSYVGWNNANTSSGETAYNRVWGIFYPPLDYPNSSGGFTWKRAAYMAVGWEFANVPAGASQNVTSVQVEQMPLTGDDGFDDTSPGPSPYDTPRALHVIVKPTRLNFCTNPSFGVSTAGWTALGSSVLTQDGTVALPASFGEWDGVLLSAGASSCKVVSAARFNGLSIVVPQLIVGNTYVASCWVLVPAGTADVVMTCAGVASASLSVGTGNLATGWTQQSVIFTTNDDAPALTIALIAASGLTATPTYWTDAVLIEEGDIVSPYFDGNFANPDYLWETGGTPGLCRSYYYENLVAGQATVNDVLDRHTPLGLTVVQPLYACPYSQ